MKTNMENKTKYHSIEEIISDSELMEKDVNVIVDTLHIKIDLWQQIEGKDAHDKAKWLKNVFNQRKLNKNNQIMEIEMDGNGNRIQVKKIEIFTQNKEFTIYINKFDELIINKEQYGDGDTGIAVKPRVSNEISLS